MHDLPTVKELEQYLLVDPEVREEIIGLAAIISQNADSTGRSNHMVAVGLRLLLNWVYMPGNWD